MAQLKTTNNPKPPIKNAYKPEMLITIYEMAKTGATDQEIMGTLDVGRETWFRWKKTKPEVADAMNRGRAANKDKGVTLHEYVYKRLPPELKELWNKIHALEGHNSQYARVKKLLNQTGEQGQQMLFIHALLTYRFKTSRALQVLMIPRSQLDIWMQQKSFRDMMMQILEYKKDFFEEALFKLVRQGDPSAVIFVNRTINRDRGYNEKQEIQVNAKVEHEHKINVSQLNLSLEARKELLMAMREQQAPKGLPAPKNDDLDIIDGEVVEHEFEEEDAA